MIFSEKLQLLRKSKGFTQEEFAEKINVSRQSVTKWEAGWSYPDVANLIRISNILNVTVDYLVKDQECAMKPVAAEQSDMDEIIEFRLEANVNTYAAFMNATNSTRLDSHDYRYEKGEFIYHDTYVGGEQFAGEEAIWKNEKAVYAMNYMGRVLSDKFSGDFLKEALKKANHHMPYRGPEYYQAGEFTYCSKVSGEFHWFQGYEEIYWINEKIYECYFHGGLLR